jgi:hypothetical protein
MSFQFGALTDDASWEALYKIVGLGVPTGTALHAGQAFRDVGAISYLYEPRHVDRDFSAAFASFYASLFTPYLKYCRRLHFFAHDVTKTLGTSDPQAIAEELERDAAHYLGFVVLRPLTHAPIGLAVISSSHFTKDACTEISVRAPYKVHILGAEVVVLGTPLTQQDTRVGACAQAAIWTVGRHLHNRHDGAWFSMPDISELALKPTDAMISQSVPAGSSFLTIDNMVRALRGMGRHPVVYARPPTGDWVTAPKDVIYRYLDSGIPVIVGLRQKGEAIGHAVVAVGRVIDKTAPAKLPPNPTQPLPKG